MLRLIPKDSRGRPPGAGAAVSRQVDTHVRSLTASTAAALADGEPLLIWSSATNAFVGSATNHALTEARATVRRMTRVWCAGGGGETGLLDRDLVAERFARLGRWLNAVPGRLEKLRKRANALNVREILGAAVYLKIIQRLSTEEALNVLPVAEPAIAVGAEEPEEEISTEQAGGNTDLVWRYRCLLDDIGSG